jgi:hypothetical protein
MDLKYAMIILLLFYLILLLYICEYVVYADDISDEGPFLTAMRRP